METMLSLRNGVAIAAALGSLASARAAGTLLSLYAATNGDAHSFQTGFKPDLSVASAVAATGLSGSADAAADVKMGEIHVGSHAVIGKGAGLRSVSTVEARANDEIVGTGAYDKQPIRVRWTLLLTGSGYGAGEGLTDGTFEFVSGSDNDNVGTTYRLQISNGKTTYDGFYSGSATVDATYLSGQRYAMGLAFFSTVDYFGGNAAGTGGLDFQNTAHAYAQVLTPGATLSSVSGHGYAAPVPEPTACAALGLAALAVARRRKRA